MAEILDGELRNFEKFRLTKQKRIWNRLYLHKNQNMEKTELGQK